MKVQGTIKLIFAGHGRGHDMNGNSYCQLNYYSIEGRRAIIKSWIEMYENIVIQICPKLNHRV